ncbi:MAG: WD40/YVTN/BNR-like repeat-containing protein [Candidatus Binataceae bacterium]
MSVPRPDAIEAILKRAFATPEEPRGHDCPDPAMLASWYDRSLVRDEFSRVDTHIADCAICQSIVASIARAEEALTPAPESPGWRWLLNPQLMVPAVAGIIAIIMVARVFRQPWSTAPVPQQIAFEQKPVAAVMQSEARQEPAPAAAAPNQIVGAMPAPSALPATPPSPAIFTAEALTGSNTENAVRANSLMSMAVEQAAPSNQATGVPRPLHLAHAMARIAAPDSSTVWLVGPRGLIFRREGTGPLRAETSGVSTDLAGGAALSSQVCWLVGRSGTVLRTTDGEHWSRLSAPTTRDLIGVQPRSAESAVVVARGGLRYLTTDGGRTWSLL